MNRVEYQKWLDQFPEDTVIECLVAKEERGHWYSYTTVYNEPFDGTVEYDWMESSGDMYGKMFEYKDWGRNRFVKPDDSYYNKKVLQIGMKE